MVCVGIAQMRALSRASRWLSAPAARYDIGFFLKQKSKLTPLPVLRYSSGVEKVV
jgi:hypothetical protein